MTDVSEESQNESPDTIIDDSGSPDTREPDLVIPGDPILDQINNQCVTNENLDPALHAYLSSITVKLQLHLTKPSMYIFPRSTILLMLTKLSMVL